MANHFWVYRRIASNSTVIMSSLEVRMWWLCRLLGIGVILPVCLSCALLRRQTVEPAPTLPLPEVRRITFTGNSQFSSRTLLGEMVTKPRPFLQFWKRGEPYNLPYLTRGFAAH